MLSYVSPLNFEVREAQIDLPLSIISSSFAPPENVNLKIIDKPFCKDFWGAITQLKLPGEWVLKPDAFDLIN